MIQTIYLIMVVMQKRRDGVVFDEYVKENIEVDILEFLPEGIHFIKCELSHDFYVENIMNKIYGLEGSTDIPYALAISKNIMEITFSSDKELKFRELPWLEEYIGDAAEYYDRLGVIFPYLIKDGDGYTFRITYKTATPFTNDDSEELEEDFSLLTSNALFLKHHFYREDIPDDCYSGIAKAMLVHTAKEEE